jgi:hypothetical protein
VGQADGSGSLEEAFFSLVNPNLNSPSFSLSRHFLGRELCDRVSWNRTRVVSVTIQRQIRFVSEKRAFSVIVTGRTLFKKLRKV